MFKILFSLFATSTLFAQPVALVTGATKGIGLATCKLLAEKGYEVYGGARHIEECKDAPHLHFIKLDVTQDDSVQRAVSHIIQREGHIDLLINNAGFALAGAIECLTLAEIQKQMDVNFYGVIRICQEVLPHMRAQKGGRILNISSSVGVWGLPYGSLYSASKSAMEAISEALSIEMLPWNIFVSIVEPGGIATNFAIQGGSRIPPCDPYQSSRAAIVEAQKEREGPFDTAWQSAEDVALQLYQIAQESAPQLRYQTSQEARESIHMKLKESAGDDFTKAMRASPWITAHQAR